MRIYPDNFNQAETILPVHPLSTWVCDRLEKYIEGFCKSNLNSSDCVITNAPAAPPYVFNKKQANTIVDMGKPIFVFSDADGYAPDCDDETGFGDFIRGGKNIKGYFYREWWKEYERPDLSFPLIPFDLIPYDQTWDYPIESKQNFVSRLDLFMSQSIHVQSRKLLYQALKDRKHCFINDAYQCAIPFGQLLKDQGEYKISIALEGSGIKSTSHCEAGMNSVMAMSGLKMYEPFPWIDGENCIRLIYKEGGEGSFIKPEGRGVIDVEASIAKLDYYLSDLDKLYEIYCNGVTNAKRYAPENYYREHVAKKILELI